MTQPDMNIVIPTYRRADILRQCLDALALQTVADHLEVIVVSDGHDPATATLFKNRSWPIPITFQEIPKSHQGTARNRGVTLASAPLCLFINDDIFLAPDACEKHIEAHRSCELRAESCENQDSSLKAQSSKLTAVLGFITWDPAFEITPVMRWLEETGWQFGYPLIEAYAGAYVSTKMQHRFTYTSHLSLPTSIAHAHAFREDVSLYGWEDIEWGVRLRDAGIRVQYQPEARAFHHHSLTLADSLKRMETLGKAAVHLSKLNPKLDRLPRGWKRTAYALLSLLPTMRGQHARAFLRGIHHGEGNLRFDKRGGVGILER